MSPPSLPLELLDAILFHVPTPSLPILALASHTLSALAHSHLAYRTIRTRLSNAPLWAALAGRAARVESLTILPEDAEHLDSAYRADLPLDERVPPGFSCPRSGSDADAEQLMIRALKRMTRLTQFRWLRVPQPEGGAVWDALNALGTVQRLHVVDIGEEGDAGGRSIVRNEAFLRIRGLQSLKIRTSAFTRAEEGVLLRKMVVPVPEQRSAIGLGCYPRYS
ncbi:hypothetical protein OE88DRAFT_1666270 [Heliocybe sulcata]|uniref:F-box domain-containing protein n=1 Tax=Heliocybe sulcata TaxID=5364 RepID=A0A5C3MSQ4_9AGAM|nr:hypothetical protein OE88DRAFT_1666270 [Heliocybe sulcata]